MRRSSSRALLVVSCAWGAAVGCQREGRPIAPHDDPQAPAPALSPRTVEVLLHFPNQRYVETGDEALTPLVTEPRALEPESDDASALVQAALRALQSGPAAKGALPAIPDRIRILGARVEGGVAQVDLAREGLSGGSLEEQLLVSSIVQTLTELTTVHAVRFLVEGEPAETLMGHVDVTQPIEGRTSP